MLWFNDNKLMVFCFLQLVQYFDNIVFCTKIIMLLSNSMMKSINLYEIEAYFCSYQIKHYILCSTIWMYTLYNFLRKGLGSTLKKGIPLWWKLKNGCFLSYNQCTWPSAKITNCVFCIFLVLGGLNKQTNKLITLLCLACILGSKTAEDI